MEGGAKPPWTPFSGFRTSAKCLAGRKYTYTSVKLQGYGGRRNPMMLALVHEVHAHCDIEPRLVLMKTFPGTRWRSYPLAKALKTSLNSICQLQEVSWKNPTPRYQLLKLQIGTSLQLARCFDGARYIYQIYENSNTAVRWQVEYVKWVPNVGSMEVDGCWRMLRRNI